MNDWLLVVSFNFRSVKIIIIIFKFKPIICSRSETLLRQVMQTKDWTYHLLKHLTCFQNISLPLKKKVPVLEVLEVTGRCSGPSHQPSQRE